jgi:hypothetical protein
MPKAPGSTTRRIILAGANPGLRLFDTEGQVIAFASIWMVDWSIRGAGTAIVLWHDGLVRVVSGDVDLGSWLERYFVRSFLEVQGLEWPEPVVERDLVQVSMNLTDGLSAKAADIRIEMGGVLDRRLFATDHLRLDGIDHSLSLLIAPVRSAALTIGGESIPGLIQVDGTPGRPSSSAFLTTAEVWRR